MRARQRHFNPANAGGTAVFDSRYINGISDGGSVQTWTSRSGSNDITQATAANRPTYETNEINGNPSVFFNGALNRSLVFAGNINYVPFSYIIVYKNLDAANGSVLFARNNNFVDYVYLTTNTHLCYIASGSRTCTHNLGNVFLIHSATYSNPSWSLRTNGSSTATGSNSTTDWQINNIGQYPDQQFNTHGHVGLAVLANIEFSASIRKRLEHAAAYSFKLPCS